MLQIIVSIDAPAGLAQAVKEALASYLDLFGRSRVVEVNEILPQQLRLSCSGGHLRHPSGRSRIGIAQKGPPADTGGVRLKPCAAAQGLTLPKKSRRTLFPGAVAFCAKISFPCGIGRPSVRPSSSKQSLRHDPFFPGKGQPTKICVQ